jgi:hypothetical protein
MLTGHLKLGAGSVLIIGVTPDDRAELAAGRAVVLDGDKFGLPELKIFVHQTEDEQAFRACIYSMIAEAQDAAGRPLSIYEVPKEVS